MRYPGRGLSFRLDQPDERIRGAAGALLRHGGSRCAYGGVAGLRHCTWRGAEKMQRGVRAGFRDWPSRTRGWRIQFDPLREERLGEGERRLGVRGVKAPGLPMAILRPGRLRNGGTDGIPHARL